MTIPSSRSVRAGLMALVVATVGLTTMTRANPARATGATFAPPVVAIVEEAGFSPYHFDFLGHPWNTDSDPANDIGFTSGVPGHPRQPPHR